MKQEDTGFSGPPSYDMSREVRNLRNGLDHHNRILVAFDNKIASGIKRLDAIEREQLRMAGMVSGISASHIKLTEAVESLDSAVKGLTKFSEESAKESELRHRDAINMHNQLADLLGHIQVRSIVQAEDLTSHKRNEPLLYRWVIGSLILMGSMVPVLAYHAWPYVKQAIK